MIKQVFLPSHSEVAGVLPSVAEEVILSTEQLLEQLNQTPLVGDIKDLIRTQVISLRDPDHRVRQIVRKFLY